MSITLEQPPLLLSSLRDIGLKFCDIEVRNIAKQACAHRDPLVTETEPVKSKWGPCKFNLKAAGCQYAAKCVCSHHPSKAFSYYARPKDWAEIFQEIGNPTTYDLETVWGRSEDYQLWALAHADTNSRGFAWVDNPENLCTKEVRVVHAQMCAMSGKKKDKEDEKTAKKAAKENGKENWALALAQVTALYMRACMDAWTRARASPADLG